MDKFNLKDFTLGIETMLRLKNLKSVVIFQKLKSGHYQRIKVSSVLKNKKEIRINFGRLNYSEREYVARFKKQKKEVPKVLLIPLKKKKK